MSQHEPQSAEDIIFDANLQEFANRVSIICGLESNGKISAAEAYQRIRDLYKQLKRSKKNLQVGEE